MTSAKRYESAAKIALILLI